MIKVAPITHAAPKTAIQFAAGYAGPSSLKDCNKERILATSSADAIINGTKPGNGPFFPPQNPYSVIASTMNTIATKDVQTGMICLDVIFFKSYSSSFSLSVVLFVFSTSPTIAKNKGFRQPFSKGSAFGRSPSGASREANETRLFRRAHFGGELPSSKTARGGFLQEKKPLSCNSMLLFYFQSMVINLTTVGCPRLENQIWFSKRSFPRGFSSLNQLLINSIFVFCLIFFYPCPFTQFVVAILHGIIYIIPTRRQSNRKYT